MPAITITDLTNAKLDVDHIAQVANSDSATATDRLGQTKSTAFGAIAAIMALNNRGAWAAITAYAVNDLVLQASTWYACMVAHTSSAAFATDESTKWRVHQRRVSEIVIVTDYGAVSDGVTNDAVAVVAANTAAGDTPLCFRSVTHIGTAITITAPILDTMAQIFSATSLVTIDNGFPVRPEWWGGGATGFGKAVVSSNLIALADATYQSPYTTTPLSKNNLKIIGSRMPRFKSDNTGLEHGTIIQGGFRVQASGFQAHDLGFDSGSAVCTSLNGGVAMDGLLVYTETEIPTFKDLVIQNIIAICQSYNAAVHAVALENCENLSADNIRTMFGTHGQAYKCVKSNVSNIRASGSNSNGVVIKAALVADCQFSNFNNVIIDEVTGFASGGLRLTANEGIGLFGISISNLQVTGTSFGIDFDTAGADEVTGITVSNFNIQYITQDGINLEGDTVRNLSFSHGVIKNCGRHGMMVPSSVTDISISDVRSFNNTESGFVLGTLNGGQSRISDCIAESNGEYGFVFSNPYWLTSNLCARTNTLDGFSGLNQYPTFLGAWENYGGTSSPATYRREGEDVVLQGLIKSGVSGTNAFVLPAGFTPQYQLWFTTVSTPDMATIIVEPGGQVTVNGSSTFTSLEGIRFKYSI